MAIIYKCDICGKDSDRQDLHILEIKKEKTIVGPTSGGQDYTFVPVITPKEICVFCQEIIIEFLNKMERDINEESQA